MASNVTGTVFVMGQGELGQLGLGEDILERGRPMAVKQLPEAEVVQIVCGGVHTAALTKTGKV